MTNEAMGQEVDEAPKDVGWMAEQTRSDKSRFLSAAGHDLRQPLQTLNLLQGILARRVKDPAGARLVAKLEETLGAMTSMLNALLDIEQIEAGNVRPVISAFPIATLLNRLESEFVPHMVRQDLNFRVVASHLEVDSDFRLLQEILRNLLANAMRYTERGKVLLGCRRRGRMLRIEVWDTGSGIPSEELQGIFEEFHRLGNDVRGRHRGLGLGLSIVRRLGDLLGHEIEVRSWPGRGSMFAVTVPLKERQQKPDTGAGAPRASVTGAILIIGDDAATREMLSTLFAGQGHRVAAVEGGDEALAIAAQGTFLPDVIIADYHLDGGLTGVEVIARLRENLRRDLPAIILAGDESPATLRRIAEAGCVHLSKLAATSVLEEQITGMLGEVPRPVRTSMPVARGPRGTPASTVFVVDDERAAREDMQDLLREYGYQTQAYASGEDFLAAVPADRDGCVIIDALMPGMGGIALLERLASSHPGLVPIMITGHGDVAMAVQAMKAGAADFLAKPVRVEELVSGVESALERRRNWARRTATREAAAERIAGLTPRERDVLRLVVQGRPNKLIAASLGVSQRTVENHRASLMRKAGVDTLPDLIRLVMAVGDD